MDSRAYWYEYPVGLGSELWRAAVRTLTPFGIGLGVTFAVSLTVGLVNEEDLLWDVMYDMGLGGDLASAVSKGIDYLLRYSMGLLLVGGYLVGLAVCVAMTLRDITTSTALAAAASSGASKEAVPPPHQVRSVIEEEFVPILGFIYGSIGVLGLFVVPLFFFGISSGFLPGVLVSLAGMAYLAGLGYVAMRIHRTVIPAQRRRRELIAEHWTTAQEGAAWTAARAANKGSHATGGGDRRVRIGARIVGVGGALAGVSAQVLYWILVITHPDAQHWPGGQLGERATLDPAMENLIDIAMWGSIGLVILAVGVAVVGFFIEGAGHTAEKATLRQALADPAAQRPPEELLERYSERQSVRFAQLMAMFAGIGLVFGPSALVLGSADTETFSGSVEIFAGFRLPAIITIIASALLLLGSFVWHALVNARGRDLRNELMRRWPTLPEAKTDSDGNTLPSHVGPVLTKRTT